MIDFAADERLDALDRIEGRLRGLSVELDGVRRENRILKDNLKHALDRLTQIARLATSEVHHEFRGHD